jgi:hypothetical protein
VFHSTADRERRRPVTVRVIEYTIDDGREPGSLSEILCKWNLSPQILEL